jgi:hypothetical protein
VNAPVWRWGSTEKDERGRRWRTSSYHLASIIGRRTPTSYCVRCSCWCVLYRCIPTSCVCVSITRSRDTLTYISLPARRREISFLSPSPRKSRPYQAITPHPRPLTCNRQSHQLQVLGDRKGRYNRSTSRPIGHERWSPSYSWGSHRPPQTPGSA